MTVRITVDCDERDCKARASVTIGALPGEGWTWSRVDLQNSGWSFRPPRPCSRDHHLKARCPRCNKKSQQAIVRLREKRKELKHGK